LSTGFQRTEYRENVVWVEHPAILLSFCVMKRIYILLGCALACALLPAAAQTPKKPKLVVTIVVDQFRYDYLTRFASQYQGGISTLLQVPTVTAVGHSVIMSGANPAESGIVANAWYSRDENRLVTAVCDSSVEIVGAPTPKQDGDCNDASPASPRRLLVDTVGDELKIANDQAKVIGISLKPRAAILPSGHMANGAFWFDESGVFVSSSFYGKALPAWAAEFNKPHPADQYAGKEWMGIKFASGVDLYRAIPASPWGNELVESFAEAAVEGENLGGRGVTDLLTISFSSNDYVGHRVGPDDPAVQDMALRTDHVLDRFFHFLNSRHIAPGEALIVFSADHGVAPLPEKDADRRMPGNRMSPGQIVNAVEGALTARFGPGEWVVQKPVEYVIYLNLDLITERKLDRAEVDRVAADAIASKPYIYRVYTREQLASGVYTDRIARAMSNGFFGRRSGDIFVLLDPYWITSMTGTTHGTPFNYDTHVPVIFMGTGVRPGVYNQNISVTDIAPTLATMLGIEMPSGAEGRALSEIMAN
jgi:predicted AlkP superfamily pyrophosphatase or phosphodiesterase